MFSAKYLRVPSRVERFDVAHPGARQLLLATAAALTMALATYGVARSISGDLLVNGRDGRTPVPLGAVAGATVVGGLAAWVIVRIANRTGSPRVVFLALVMVGVAVSSVAPVAAATTFATAAWLLLLHIVVAVPLVAVAWRLVGGPA